MILCDTGCNEELLGYFGQFLARSAPDSPARFRLSQNAALRMDPISIESFSNLL